IYWDLLVGAARFELATPSPPDWCANRAALRSAEKFLRRVFMARKGRRIWRPRRTATARVGTRHIAARRGNQSPQQAEQQESVPPVVAIDDDAFGRDAEIARIDDDRGRLPGRAGERAAQSVE